MLKQYIQGIKNWREKIKLYLFASYMVVICNIQDNKLEIYYEIKYILV